MDIYKVINWLNKHKRLIIFLVVSLSLLLYLSRMGYINIEVANSNGSQLTYQLIDKSGRVSSETKTKSAKLKKRVGKGQYSILVTQTNNSSFSRAIVRGFFSSSATKVTLTSERARQFVGDNPDVCTYYSQNILYSYSCRGDYNTINIHVPAAVGQPTYVLPNNGGQDGSIEGIVKTKSGSVALLYTGQTPDSDSSHTAYLLNNGLATGEYKELINMDSNSVYSVKPYWEGFLVYNEDFNRLLYYPSIKSDPQAIKIDRPKDKDFRPMLLQTKGSDLLVVYSTQKEGEDSDTPIKISVKNEVFVYSQNKLRSFSISGSVGDMVLCGNQKLCVLSDNSVNVYDISSQKAMFLYSVANVKYINGGGNHLIAVQENRILDLDVDKQLGYISYSLGEYRYCGLQYNDPGYLLCMISPKNKKSAILLDTNQPDTNSIDKKASELGKMREIKSISAYGQYIFISPDFGPLSFNSDLGTYDYASSTKTAVTGKINQSITQIGIDRTKYTITIIGAQ